MIKTSNLGLNIVRETAIDLLKRKKRVLHYSKYCASIGVCNYDSDLTLLHESRKYWFAVRKIAKGGTT